MKAYVQLLEFRFKFLLYLRVEVECLLQALFDPVVWFPRRDVHVYLLSADANFVYASTKKLEQLLPDFAVRKDENAGAIVASLNCFVLIESDLEVAGFIAL